MDNDLQLPDIRRDEFIQRVERLRSDLTKINQSWDNRLSAKRCSFSEIYLNGDAEIVLYGDRAVGNDRIKWAVRIVPKHAAIDCIGPRLGVDVFDVYNGSARHEIPVLVTVAHSVDGPELEIASFVRLYILNDVDSKVGAGLMYSDVVTGAYKFFPFSVEGEIGGLPARLDLSEGVGNPVVEGLSKVVDGIPYHAAKGVADWLFGPVGKEKLIWLCEHRNAETVFNSKFIQVLGKGSRFLYEGINVAIGPFDLRPCSRRYDGHG